ncbi:MAG TPA: YihY/virulence factor BrkB family protein [Prolixibacteraceae bacterium]|nr:YihY/virulence factor BrkB family protein [Prolixibacteraceae bacterium]
MKEDKKEDEKKLGHNAKTPFQIPIAGWKKIALRVKDEIRLDNVIVVSAGVAFYFFLAFIPALAASVSIYGLVVTPDQAEQQMTQLADSLPEETYRLISTTLNRVAGQAGSTLSWSLVFSILLSVWSSNRATDAVFEAMNIAYDEKENRSFFKKKALTLLFTVAGGVIGILSMVFIIAYPTIVNNFDLPEILKTSLAQVRWLVLAAILFFVLAIIYKIAPFRSNPKFIWIVPGALLATLLWIGGSMLFALYIKHFGTFDRTYGSFAAVIILMLWFFLSGFIIIMGAEVNSEIEHQTYVDTTVGPDKQMGERGAYHADNTTGQNKIF